VIAFPKGVTAEHVKATDGLGRVFQSTGRLKEAENTYREVLAIWETVLNRDPGNRHYRWNAAAASQQLGEFFQTTGRGKEAGEAYRRALKVWEDLTAQYPTVPAYPRQLAWFLACGPVLELRNPARAATLAGKATEQAANDGHNWTTLAAARYRTGNWIEAQVALEKAMNLRPWGEALDWFLLAMIRWRAGDKPDALRWYDKAVEWMVKNDAYNDELRRLKIEAAELLGLTKK
jgi:tetratricopeptide (TPR) repeat protein